MHFGPLVGYKHWFEVGKIFWIFGHFPLTTLELNRVSNFASLFSQQQFWVKSSTSDSTKKFLDMLWIWYGYPKCFPRLGLSIAHLIMTVRLMEKKRRSKIEKSSLPMRYLFQLLICLMCVEWVSFHFVRNSKFKNKNAFFMFQLCVGVLLCRW